VKKGRCLKLLVTEAIGVIDMGKQERLAYLKAIRGRYKKADRAGKGKILDEFCAVCGYARKYALRLLNRTERKVPAAKPGRPSRYAREEIMTPLRAIWLATDQMASKRLVSALPIWLPHYEAVHGTLDSEARKTLLAISPATVDRVLGPIRAQAGRRGLSGTKPGTLLKNQIPLQTNVWDTAKPGFMEADTVAHCGTSLAGDFVWSLTMTDLYSGWTECRATWNKGSSGVIAQIQNIQDALPFALRGFDCDNGSEFLNWHLLRHFQNRDHPIQFTRSRPYQSNDNAHVEQKNWSCVRQLFGYDRVEKPEVVALMNDLYANEFSLMNNFFYPTMKLAEKKRVGSKIIKKHAPPQTPAQRIINHSDTDEATKERLRRKTEELNPFELRSKIQKKLRRIFKLLR
jgi:hypothetical protein